MWRSCPDGHLTGSTLVVDATGTRALFTLHPKIGRWLQMGGHCEPGDADLAATARREAVEESGIDGLVLLPGPVDLDIHALQCPKGHPNRHLDVRWLAVAPAGATVRPSDESPDLRWFPLDAPPPDADESTLRLVRLARREGHRLGVRHLTSPSGPPPTPPLATGPPGRAAHTTRHPWRVFVTLRERAGRRARAAARRQGPAGRSRPFVTLAGVTPEDFRKQRLRARSTGSPTTSRASSSYPSPPRSSPARSAPSCPPHPPTEPEPFDAVLADLDRVIVPGLTHWQHPSFFAYFPANTTYPSILGELAAAGLGVQRHARGPPARPAPRSRRSCSTGWSSCSACPTASAPTGPGGGVIQGIGVRGDALRHPRGAASGRPAARSNTRRCARRPRRLRHLAGPLVDREGRAHRRHRQRQPPHVVAARRGVRHAPRRAGRRHRRRPRRRAPALLRVRHRRHDVDHWPSTRCPSIAAICRREGMWLHVDARHGRHRRAVPRAALGQRRSRPGRLVLHQPAQVDGRELRLRPVLGGRPGRAARRAVDPARVPAHRGRRGRARSSTTATGRSPSAGGSGRSSCGSRCAATASAPVQAMIRRHVALDRRSWPAGSAADDRFELVAPHPLNLVCFAPPRRRRGHRRPDRGRQRLAARALFTRTVLDGRSVAAGLRRRPDDRAPPRRGGLGAASVDWPAPCRSGPSGRPGAELRAVAEQGVAAGLDEPVADAALSVRIGTHAAPAGPPRRAANRSSGGDGAAGHALPAGVALDPVADLAGPVARGRRARGWPRRAARPSRSGRRRSAAPSRPRSTRSAAG